MLKYLKQTHGWDVSHYEVNVSIHESLSGCAETYTTEKHEGQVGLWNSQLNENDQDRAHKPDIHESYL